MNTQQLIDQGNQYRAQRQPLEALQCYALAFVQDPDAGAAWNNYGNVMRELGQPARAIPFLQHALAINSQDITAAFNLAICYLLQGDYAQGWPAYETRWQYEHLAGTLPKHSQPRWVGQSLEGKTILVVGEQGHGDNIQFARFAQQLASRGAQVKMQVTDALIPLMSRCVEFSWVGGYTQDPGDFDYWCPIMSLPGVLGITLDTLPQPQHYLTADPTRQHFWQQALGAKTRMRVGICWSGRRDSWLNQHKGMPFDQMCNMIKANPQYQWVSLQADATTEENNTLQELGVTLFPGSIGHFGDTAALIMHMDVVVTVDTAVAHLSGALGRPTWIMLNRFATDWRWLLDRDSSPWYVQARLFRQPQADNWGDVAARISRFLSWYKV